MKSLVYYFYAKNPWYRNDEVRNLCMLLENCIYKKKTAQPLKIHAFLFNDNSVLYGVSEERNRTQS